MMRIQNLQHEKELIHHEKINNNKSMKRKKERKSYELEMCRTTNVYMASHWRWYDTQICVCGLVHTPNYSKRGAVL